MAACLLQSKTTYFMKKLLSLSALLFLLEYCGYTQSWIPVGNPGFTPSKALHLSMDIDKSNNVYVAFVNLNWQVYVMKYNGTAWTAVGSTLGTSSWAGASVKIALDTNDAPIVVFNDSSAGHRITAKKFNGTSWTNFGPSGFTAGSAFFISLAFDKRTNLPYVSFEDGANNSKASVMKYNGATWSLVGSAGFSAGQSNYTSIAIDTSGVPFIIYQNSSLDSAIVKKFTGSNWMNVGAASSGGGQNASIVISKNNIPYISYDNGNQVFCKKFNGISWQVLENGLPISATGMAIDIDSSEVPYAIIREGKVFKFIGNSWGVVGNSNLAGGGVSEPSIKFNKNNIPYVSFSDGTNGEKATVMKYTGADTVLPNNCYLYIAEQPLNQIGVIGDTAQFAISSPSEYSFQWQIDSGDGFHNINDNVTYGGTQTQILTVNGITLIDSGKKFRCKVSFGSCDTLSNYGTLIASSPTNTASNNVGINFSQPQRNLHINDVLRIQPRDTPPTNPGKGDMYFDSVLNKLRVYDGIRWNSCW